MAFSDLQAPQGTINNTTNTKPSSLREIEDNVLESFGYARNDDSTSSIKMNEDLQAQSDSKKEQWQTTRSKSATALRPRYKRGFSSNSTQKNARKRTHLLLEKSTPEILEAHYEAEETYRRPSLQLGVKE